MPAPGVRSRKPRSASQIDTPIAPPGADARIQVKATRHSPTSAPRKPWTRSRIRAIRGGAGSVSKGMASTFGRPPPSLARTACAITDPSRRCCGRRTGRLVRRSRNSRSRDPRPSPPIEHVNFDSGIAGEGTPAVNTTSCSSPRCGGPKTCPRTSGWPTASGPSQLSPRGGPPGPRPPRERSRAGVAPGPGGGGCHGGSSGHDSVWPFTTSIDRISAAGAVSALPAHRARRADRAAGAGNRVIRQTGAGSACQWEGRECEGQSEDSERRREAGERKRHAARPSKPQARTVLCPFQRLPRPRPPRNEVGDDDRQARRRAVLELQRRRLQRAPSDDLQPSASLAFVDCDAGLSVTGRRH